MIVDMLKYSQIVWAYLILDAAAIATMRIIDLPPRTDAYQVQEESSESRPIYKPFNITFPLEPTVLPSQLGLFVSQPPATELFRQDVLGPESRYGLTYDYPTFTKKRRGVNPRGVSLFTKLEKDKPRDLFEKYKENDYRKRQVNRGSDRYLSPQFVKFKNEIEKETEKTHLKGLKMSKDTSFSPTVVYENPAYRKYKFPKTVVDNPISLGDESFRKPYYDDPENTDDSSSSSYPKSHSYQQYSSSIPNEPYLPPNFESSGISYPPYPPLPSIDTESYNSPRSEVEARNHQPHTYSSFNSFPSSYQNHDDVPSFPLSQNHNPPTFPKEDEESETADFNPEDYPPLPTRKPPRKYVDSEDYRKTDDTNNVDEPVNRRGKLRRNRVRNNRLGRPYGEPSEVPVSVSRNEEEDDEGENFESNYESPSDPFLNDENESEEEDDTPPTPRGRLRQPSRQQAKRIQPAAHRKRCVKKRKDVSMDDLDDEPGRQMACLVCENLDTGGTYETCSYESEPKKNSYFVGNAASYRKGSTKPSKYRFKREAARKDDTAGSYTADPEDFGPDNFSFDENEELQDDEDELEEYKPQPPAYANEHSCKQVVRNGVTCMVCRNPETNGKYEQCSYANEPDDNYEYAQSSSYGKKNVPYNIRYKRGINESEIHEDKENENVTDTTGNADSNLLIPAEWRDLRDVEQKKIEQVNEIFRTLIRTKKEQPNSKFLFDLEDSSYEEQFLNLFPEMNSGSEADESMLKELEALPKLGRKDEDISGFKTGNKLGGYFKNLPKKNFLSDPNDSEMSKMMKEFKSKDRSACTKKLKDKMTCYVCNDKDGMKREECMYVVEDEPTKATYHELKQLDDKGGKPSKREIRKKPKSMVYKYVPPGEMQPASQTLVHKTVEARKYGTPANAPSYSNVQIHTEKTYALKAVPSNVITRRRLPKVVREPDADGSSNRGRFKRGKASAKRDEDPQLEDPEENGEYTAVEVVPEADPSSPDGAFTDDTEVVFDPELKTTLPKFMVEKSEHEKIIDDFIKRL